MFNNRTLHGQHYIKSCPGGLASSHTEVLRIGLTLIYNAADTGGMYMQLMELEL